MNRIKIYWHSTVILCIVAMFIFITSGVQVIEFIRTIQFFTTAAPHWKEIWGRVVFWNIMRVVCAGITIAICLYYQRSHRALYAIRQRVWMYFGYMIIIPTIYIIIVFAFLFPTIPVGL